MEGMPSAPSRTTILENLHLPPHGASLQFEGQSVNLHGDVRDPVVGAFHAFYQGALADYRGREEPPPRAGLLQRVRSWFARLLGIGAAKPAAGIDPPTVPAAPAPVRSPALPGPPPAPPAAPVPEKSAKRTAPAAAMPLPTDRTPAPAGRPTEPAAAAARGPAPQLRSAYADRAGVHLLWEPGSDRTPGDKIELIYPLNSAVAERLQDCYGQLAKLGYKIVGLELLKPELAPAPADAEESPAPPAAPSAGPQAAPKTAAPAEALRAPPAEKKERTLVMRLHPAAPEEPNRALVAPVENQENLQVLVAPERLVRALYAAADAARPPDQRVTYLRCALGKSGLKVVDVGLGEGPEAGPNRWQEVAAWWESAAKSPEPAEKKPRAAPLAAPSAAPELGLF